MLFVQVVIFSVFLLSHARSVDDIEYYRPEGGYFVWLNLKKKFEEKGITAEEVLNKSKQNGLNFFAGPLFSPKGEYKYALRLSFAMYAEKELEEGIGRLSKVLKLCLNE